MNKHKFLWLVLGVLVVILVTLRMGQVYKAYHPENPLEKIEEVFSTVCTEYHPDFPGPVYGEDSGWYARAFDASGELYVDLTIGIPVVALGESYYYCTFQELVYVEGYIYDYILFPVNYWVVFDSQAALPIIEGCALLSTRSYVPTDIFEGEFRSSSEYVCEKK